jgi:hypothetical protein
MSGGFNLARWQPHLEAAKREGKTLKDYAAEHGISRHTLYGARQVQRLVQSGGRLNARAGGNGSAKPIAKSSFSAVRVVSGGGKTAPAKASLRMRAHLPNGVMLEWQSSADTALMAKLIGTLASLRCSG